ncbi:MAG TPA: ImmA/IrrE family metallo-endopeptidase [Gemmatimonadales bacterium]|nr:ImmA/IrrE family metallo-endopeptidase [Gemmatimonadales bacterium]
MNPLFDRWTNTSVLAFSSEDDPVTTVIQKSRALVLRAIDKGWAGPPFDPLKLATLLEIRVSANGAVREARLIRGEDGEAQIEYNPTRPRGRLRYSIAHEIAHTLFPDWADQIRHRGPDARADSDEWQLETLCNIAASEILMPLSDCSELGHPDADIHVLLEEQKRFDVSTEALLVRAVRVREDPCAVFCASKKGNSEDSPYSIDYTIGSRAWTGGVRRGMALPKGSAVAGCTGIGFTAKADEDWGETVGECHVEAVGIPPYPGSSYPRVVGLLRPTEGKASKNIETIQYVRGDATHPQGVGARVIVHIVNDQAQVWGGHGFAASLRKTHKGLQQSFRDWVIASRDHLSLGRTHFAETSEGLVVASMVAQHGFGPSDTPRIRYEALQICLNDVLRHAQGRSVSVHMPRIGTGNAGGKWNIIKEVVENTLIEGGVSVTVYDPV